MKVLNPLKTKFPIKIENQEDYIKKSEWLFSLGYKSYAKKPIHKDVIYNPFPFYINYNAPKENWPFGLTVSLYAR